jgi:hypothetical protein
MPCEKDDTCMSYEEEDTCMSDEKYTTTALTLSVSLKTKKQAVTPSICRRRAARPLLNVSKAGISPHPISWASSVKDPSPRTTARPPQSVSQTGISPGGGGGRGGRDGLW